MTDKDKSNFMKLINSIMEMYSQPEVELSLMRVWFAKLQEFDFQTVCKAFDVYTSKNTSAPTPIDIIKLCPRPTKFSAIAAPRMALEDSKKHADQVMQIVSKTLSPTTDYKAWAKRILAKPKNYPAISIRFAKEALELRNGIQMEKVW
jgi:hypothetical protein